jgi:hypothetical protein
VTERPAALGGDRARDARASTTDGAVGDERLFGRSRAVTVLAWDRRQPRSGATALSAVPRQRQRAEGRLFEPSL